MVEGKELAWTAALPGKGASSPIIVGDRVYLTAQTSDTGLHLLAIDRQRGEILWDREISRANFMRTTCITWRLLRPCRTARLSGPSLAPATWPVWTARASDLAAQSREGIRRIQNEPRLRHFTMLFAGHLFIACMHQGHPTSSPWTRKRQERLEERPQLGTEGRGAGFVFQSHLPPRRRPDPGRARGRRERQRLQPGHRRTDLDLRRAEGPASYGRTISGPTAGDRLVVTVASGFQNRVTPWA